MQQINLLQSQLIENKQQLPLKPVLGGLLALLLLLSSISGWQWWQHSNQLARQQQLQAEQESLNLAIQNISDELRQISDDAELKRILAQRESEANNKTRVLSLLSGRRLGNTTGFAEYLAGLSRQHVAGLWITHLNILDGGEKMNLQGASLQPEYVPRYLQRLANEPNFKGLEFQTFMLERDSKERRIDFNVRSTAQEAG